MSDSLFPTPPVPVSAHGALGLAAQAATLSRMELHRALTRETKAWDPEAVAELARLMNAAEHLAASIRALLPS